MARRPTYEELEQRIKELEREAVRHKEADEALRQSEERYRLVAENVSDVLWMRDMNLKFTYVSSSVEKLSGYTVEEAMTLPIEKIYTSRSIALALKALEEEIALEKDESSNPSRVRKLELEGYHKNGSTVWTESKMIFLRDSAGRVSGILGVSRDITERKKMERAVIEAREDWERTFDAVPDLIAILDKSYRIVRVNKAMAECLGMVPEEAIGLTCYEHIHGTKAPPSFCPHAKLLVDGKEHSVEVREQPLGGDFLVSVSPVYNTEGQLSGSVHVARNITESKRAEEAVRASEERIRSIFTAAPIGIGVVVNRLLTEVNQRFCHMVGYTRDELINQSARIVYPSDEDYELVGKEKYHQIAEQGTGTVETRFRRKDGQIIQVMLSSTPIDLSDVSRGVTFTALDITEQKRTDEALRRQADELSALYTTSLEITRTHHLTSLLETIVQRATQLLNGDGGGMYMCDGKRQEARCVVSYKTLRDYTGTILKYGEGAAGIVAQTGEPLIVDDYHAWQGRAPVYEMDKPFNSVISVPLKWQGEVVGIIHVLQIKETRKFTEADLRVLTLFANQAVVAIQNARLVEDAKGRAVELQRKVIEEGRRTAELKTTNEMLEREIEHRNQVEKALRESEEKYRLLVQNANDAIFIAQDGLLKFPNPMTEKMTGYSHEELSKIPFANFLHPEDKEMVLENHRKRLKGEPVPTTYSFRIISKTGREIDVQLSAVLITWEGRPASLNFLRDITEQRRLENQFHAAQRLESLGTLAGGIAHDFNNLLMGIQGRTSLMLMDMDSSHPHFGHLKGIEDYVMSAADLSKQLLGFARGGKYEVKPTNLNEVLEKSSTLFARTKKEIRIHGKYQEGVWSVEVDRGQIQQVLMNLYVNAWQAMPGGGDLYLETENVMLDEDFVKPFGVLPGRYVRMSVTDTGIGMDEETKRRLFEPFFTTKGMGRGTGLGLASAYGIIRNHRGIIDIHSEKGEGSRFSLYLPASHKEYLRTKESEENHLLRGHETLLLVDDEETVVEVSRQMLERLGYQVLIARGGRQAIEVLRANESRIDLVILDMIMPDMGGEEAYGHLKDIKPNVKVLLSSGYSISGQAQEILNRGCNGFIQKPFNLRGLSEKLREILQKK
jgi:two-component system, cell cycle sensor histidine kinase and response regulator CckA